MKKDLYNPIQTTPYHISHKLKIYLWKSVNRTIYRWIPNQIKKPRIILLKLFGANLANTVNINRKSTVDHPWNLTMGHLSSLGENTWAYCLDKITIGEKCCIGKDVYLLTGSHDINSKYFYLKTKPIIIKDCCWVCTGSYILPGAILEDYTVVAAKSLVLNSTEAFDVIGGNPAKLIKKRVFKDTE